MKITYITFLALLFCATINAQKDYKKSLEGIEWIKIESKADITVKTHSSKELLIKGGSRSQVPKKASGLKLVGEAGTDNTDAGFYVIKEGNTLIVRNLKKNERALIYLPSSQNISVVTTWQGDIAINGFLGEVEATARLNGNINIQDISGPLTANSLNGTIDVTFVKVNQSSPITIYSTNGALDISLPENTPANLSLRTTNGEVYTDFDLKMPDKKGLRAIATKKVYGSINNGGVKIQLKTTNGNMYLRKK
jgi:predicted membrane protein